MSLRLAIRVDASTAIGSGHVKRCTALAQAATDLGASVAFVARKLDMPVAESLRAQGWTCHELPAPAQAWQAGGDAVAHAVWAGVPAELDAAETVSALAGQSFDWMIVDHYSFGASWHRPVRTGLGVRIAAIDDVADRPLDVDLIVDHNHSSDHMAKYREVNLAHAPILGGPSHALLDLRYASAARYEFSPRVRSIGVFMGGADAGNYSIRTLRAIREGLAFEGPVEIVTTSSNPHLWALVEAARAHGDTRITTDLPNLCEFFAAHDLQVGAGGGATWERCCIGVPSVVIVVADNQRQVLAPLQDKDVLDMVAEVPPSEDHIARELGRIIADPAWRERLASRARLLVDGRGAARVALYLFESCNQ